MLTSNEAIEMTYQANKSKLEVELAEVEKTIIDEAKKGHRKAYYTYDTDMMFTLLHDALQERGFIVEKISTDNDSEHQRMIIRW
jgi:hypothetical protein